MALDAPPGSSGVAKGAMPNLTNSPLPRQFKELTTTPFSADVKNCTLPPTASAATERRSGGAEARSAGGSRGGFYTDMASGGKAEQGKQKDLGVLVDSRLDLDNELFLLSSLRLPSKQLLQSALT